MIHIDVRQGSTTLGFGSGQLDLRRDLGPDDLANAVALCSLHHALFDAASSASA